MNNSPSIALEQALVAYLTPLCAFAGSVSGMSDPRHADEATYGILGQYVPLPAVIVTVGNGSNAVMTVPAVQSQVTITVRHSSFRSLPATHNADANTAFDSMWDIAAVHDSIDANDSLTLSSVMATGESGPTKTGWALESSITLDFHISSKG